MTIPHNPGPFLPPKPTLKWERVKPGFYRGYIVYGKGKRPRRSRFRIRRRKNCLDKWTLHDHGRYKTTNVMHFYLLDEAKYEANRRVFEKYHDQRLRAILTYKLGEDGFSYLKDLKNRIEEAEGRLKKLEDK